MHYQRIVIKLGTSTLTAGANKISPSKVFDIVRQVVALREEGSQVILVSSGAIAAVCSRRQTDDEQTSIGDAETRQRPAPVIPFSEGAPFFARHALAIVDEARALATPAHSTGQRFQRGARLLAARGKRISGLSGLEFRSDPTGSAPWILRQPQGSMRRNRPTC